jgi:hypothetical protein
VRSDGTSAPRKATTPFLVTDGWGYAPVGAYGRPELYALGADPLAKLNVLEEHPSVAQELHALFLDHLVQHDAPKTFLSLWQDQPGGRAAGGVWAIDYPEPTL